MAKGLPLRDIPQDSVNNCDGCQAGMELDEYGRHIIGGGTYMACSKDRYSTEVNKGEGCDNETIDERITRFQKAMEAHDNEHAKHSRVQDIKESYYYKGRRDEAMWQKEQDKDLIKNLLEIVNVLSATIDPNNYTREFKSKVRDSITKAEKY